MGPSSSTSFSDFSSSYSSSSSSSSSSPSSSSSSSIVDILSIKITKCFPISTASPPICLRFGAKDIIKTVSSVRRPLPPLLLYNHHHSSLVSKHSQCRISHSRHVSYSNLSPAFTLALF